MNASEPLMRSREVATKTLYRTLVGSFNCNNIIIQKMKIQFLILLLFSSLMSYALEYEKGSIIKKDGNIVFGLIKYDADNMLKFKQNDADEVTKYTSDDLSGFNIGNKKYIVLENVAYNGPWIGKAKEDRIFAQILIEGEISLYLYRYLTMQPGTYSMYISSTQFYIHKNEMYQVKGGCKKFRKQIIQVTSDYPELTSKIAEEKMCKDDIEKIINEYNRR